MTIKILVACHKPSELPKNDLFLPIHVGSAISTKKLGIQHDDEGENISEKNPTYCELTAEYWAWKNLKNVDYCGLCHYRRYLCFRPISKIPNIKNSINLRGQIEASVLNDYNLSRFGLEDSDEMKKIIEKYDVVAGHEQMVRQLYTPRGNQSTAYKHWEAHDRALVNKKDLDRMLEVLEQESPSVGRSARSYLSGGKFMGFNCFVMKKALFDELCELQFKVLSILEKEIDISTYGSQLSRIFGFMGEIISSCFIHHLEQSGKYKVKHVPLVYFNYTDPLPNPLPKKNSIPIIFNASDQFSENFSVTWNSFLKNTQRSTNYDVNIVIKKDEINNKIYEEMAKPYSNVSVRFIDSEPFRGLLFDKFNLTDIDIKKKSPDDFQNHLSLLPFFSLIFKNYKRALIFNHNNIFVDSVDELWKNKKESEALICAPKNLYILSQVNWIYPNYENYLKTIMKNPFDYFSINAMVWNFDSSRRIFSDDFIVKVYKRGLKDLKDKEEVMNILYEKNHESISQKWCVLYESNDLLKDRLPYAPKNLYDEQKLARKNPAVVSYLPNSEYDPEISELYMLFWKNARETVFYEWFENSRENLREIRKKHTKREVLVKIFPVDGKARGQLTKIFPYDAKRTKKLKKILNNLGLR